MNRRLRARIHGRVQGVGYRYFALQRGTELRLGGWVRNCADGSVEVVAEGPPDDLGRLLEALHRGPFAARVERIEEAWTDPTGGHERFEVRY